MPDNVRPLLTYGGKHENCIECRHPRSQLKRKGKLLNIWEERLDEGGYRKRKFFPKVLYNYIHINILVTKHLKQIP